MLETLVGIALIIMFMSWIGRGIQNRNMTAEGHLEEGDRLSYQATRVRSNRTAAELQTRAEAHYNLARRNTEQ